MRSPDGRMLPFKKGPFYLAKDSGAPCIPISIYGTEKIIPWGSKRIHPGTAHIVFHPPVDPANYATRDELSDAVRAAIASALPEWMRILKRYGCTIALYPSSSSFVHMRLASSRVPNGPMRT